MKQIILGTLIAAFTATAGMAHHPFEGSNGGTREVTSVYTQKTYNKTFKVVEVETTKANGEVRTKKFYWHVEGGKWWNAKGIKLKAWLSSHI